VGQRYHSAGPRSMDAQGTKPATVRNETVRQIHCLVAVYDTLPDMLAEELAKRGLTRGEPGGTMATARAALDRFEDTLKWLRDSFVPVHPNHSRRMVEANPSGSEARRGSVDSENTASAEDVPDARSEPLS